MNKALILVVEDDRPIRNLIVIRKAVRWKKILK